MSHQHVEVAKKLCTLMLSHSVDVLYKGITSNSAFQMY